METDKISLPNLLPVGNNHNRLWIISFDEVKEHVYIPLSGRIDGICDFKQTPQERSITIPKNI